jgi:hypothetical protein
MKLRASLFFLLACLCTLLLVGLTGCTSDDDDGGGPGTGTTDGGGTDGSVTGTKDGGSDGGKGGGGDSGGGGKDGGGGEGGTGGGSFTLGGTVSGLLGTGLALNDGNGDDLAVTANGAFTFGHPLSSGTVFSVTVKTQPTGPVQTCVVAGGSGTIGSANVTSVSVNCDANKFFVSGTVNGLAGTGLVLQNNGGDNLAVSTGTFAFATTVASGQMYNVTVFTEPSNPSQSCTVTGGSGTVQAANVTTVAVTCTTTKFTVGGMLTGLGAGDTVVLQDNGGDNLTLSANGAFTFATPVASGAGYEVTAMAPTGPIVETCAVTGGKASVGGGNVTTVDVACTATPFAVGGTISGLTTGQTVMLQDNAGDNLTVAAGATTFTFGTPVASGAAYAVTVKTQPSSGSCHLFERTGTVGNGPVTTVTATCGIDYYVNAATGVNSGPGTAAAPWKSLTYAIAALPAAGGIINVAPGAYNAANGETFPLEPRTNQTLLGNPAFDGIGNGGATTISGTGTYLPGGEIGALYSLTPVIAVPPSVTGVAIRGFAVVALSPAPNEGDGIVIDGATVTLANNTISGASDLTIADLNGGNLTLLDSDVQGPLNLLVADATTAVKARRNSFAGIADNYVVRIGYTSAALVGTNVDLGTASDPGGNSFIAAATGLGMLVQTATTGVRAAGNTWRANIQGASASGAYAAALVPGPVTSAAGNNYSIVTGGSIQF